MFQDEARYKFDHFITEENAEQLAKKYYDRRT